MSHRHENSVHGVPARDLDAEFVAVVHTRVWRKKISQARLAEVLGNTQSGVSKELRGVAAWSLADITERLHFEA